MFDTCGITEGGGGPGIPPRGPDYFQCQGTLGNMQCKGYPRPGQQDNMTVRDSKLCADCGTGHLANNEPGMFYCTAESVERGCNPDPVACAAVVKKYCHVPGCESGNQSACQQCQNCMYGGNRTARLAAITANCTDTDMRSGCGEQMNNNDPFHQPFYMQWMQNFACLMQGNWYSTQQVSECKSDSEDSDCWWRLHSPVAGEVVVNATCANDRIFRALKNRHPECWQKCTGKQAQPGSLCDTSCVFNTMLGNTTLGKHTRASTTA